MTARETLRDHHFTGDVLRDFGLTEMETEKLVSEMQQQQQRQQQQRRQEQSPYYQPQQQQYTQESKESDEDVSIYSFGTGLTTVKMSNRVVGMSAPELRRGPPSCASITDGSSSASVFKYSGDDNDDDGDDGQEDFADIWTPRLIVFTALICIGASILGSIVFWLFYPVFQHTNSFSDHDRYAFQGTIFKAPTLAPTAAGSLALTQSLDEPSDLFLDTGEPPVSCPRPFQAALPLPGKKGIALRVGEDARLDLSKVMALDPYWNHVWGHQPPQNQPSPSILEFVPMIATATNSYTEMAAIVQDLSLHQTDIQRVLGFPEPDNDVYSPQEAGSDSITVDAAVDRWKLLEELNIPLASPSAQRPTGEWMTSFMQQVDDKCLRVDWIAVQWYGNASVESFKAYLEQVYSLYGKRPIILTEFATTRTREEEQKEGLLTEESTLRFLREALPWLEDQEWIAGYAWARVLPDGSPSALFDEQDQLTTIGQYYASVREDKVGGLPKMVR